MGQAIDTFSPKKCTFPVEGAVFSPEPCDIVEPFLRHRVAVTVVAGQIHTKGVVFGFVPASDDIQSDSAVGELVQCGELLRDHNGMIKRSVHGGEDLNIL